MWKKIKRAAQATFWIALFLLSWFYHGLDVIGRGEQFVKLPGYAEHLQAFAAAHQEIGYQIAPWVLMSVSILALVLMQWPNALMFWKTRAAPRSLKISTELEPNVAPSYVPVLTVAQQAYEESEDHGLGKLVRETFGEDNTIRILARHVIESSVSVYGIEPPSTQHKVLPKHEIKRLSYFEQENGGLMARPLSDSKRPKYTDLSILQTDMRLVIDEIKHGSVTEHTEPQYLPDRDSELDMAILLMAHRSAWGRWFSAQILVCNGTPIREDYLMRMAVDQVVHEAVEGNLTIRGRLPSGTEYETIGSDVWRLAHLDVKPDTRRIWGISAIPRSDVDPERISRLLSYDSLIVDSRQFEKIWPLKQSVADAQRREFLKTARKNGVDPVEIAKLS